jgi:hypothetical protein
MPTQKESDEAAARNEESVALYEAAKAEFEALAAAIAAQIAAGSIPTNAELLKEEQARARLSAARRRTLAQQKTQA